MSCFCFIMTACSRDGTVRLWDCGEATCLSVVSKSDCPVNSCALSELHGMENTSDNQTSKILFITIQDNDSTASLAVQFIFLLLKTMLLRGRQRPF